MDDTRDYIDYKNKQINLPEIKTYDGNTITESSDNSHLYFKLIIKRNIHSKCNDNNLHLLFKFKIFIYICRNKIKNNI